MNTVEVHSTSELHAMLRAARRDGRGMAALIGFGAGAVLAIGVALIVAVSLDFWRVANNDRLIREATAAVNARLGECRTKAEKCKTELAAFADLQAEIARAEITIPAREGR